MKRFPGFWQIAWLAGFAAALMAASGMAPRPNATNYPAHAAAKGAILAAALVPPDQLKRVFGADVDRGGFVVFEFAVYPEPGRQPIFAATDFMLRALPGPGTIRASSPAAVAAAVVPYGKPPNTPASLPGGIQAHGEGTPGHTAANGRSGVAVDGAVTANGNPQATPPPKAPTTQEQARTNLEFALSDKAMPSGMADHAMAGYLYFAKPTDGRKLQRFELTWFGPDAPTVLTLWAGVLKR